MRVMLLSLQTFGPFVPAESGDPEPRIAALDSRLRGKERSRNQVLHRRDGETSPVSGGPAAGPLAVAVRRRSSYYMRLDMTTQKFSHTNRIFMLTTG
jgi:hypothetical protein